MLVLSGADVEALLDLDRLVDAVATAMIDLSAGRASMPPRIAAEVAPRHGLLAAMPAYLPSSASLTTKLVSVFPENRDRPTHQAVICCFDPDTGSPVAVMDGTFVTATRTAAGSVLATRLLARRDAQVVSIIGTGVQARAHATALARLPAIKRIQLAGRDRRSVDDLVAELVARGLPVVAMPAIEEAVRSADVVCTTTHAEQPVVHREWLQPGTHINSVGYNPTGEGEIDAETVRDSLIVVESRATALADPPAGVLELRRALERGFIDAEHVRTEIGDLAAGRAEGRTDDRQLTLYKSVGVAVQDAAAAALVLEAARARGIGTTVTF